MAVAVLAGLMQVTHPSVVLTRIPLLSHAIETLESF